MLGSASKKREAEISIGLVVKVGAEKSGGNKKAGVVELGGAGKLEVLQLLTAVRLETRERPPCSKSKTGNHE